jgi:hypothetical protein
MTAPSLPIIASKFSKNSREEVQVALSDYHGKTIVNVRVWFRGDDNEMRPGKSGLAMSVKHLPALAKALADALDQAREMGLVEQ